MKRKVTLKELSEGLGLEMRTLRYVVERGLVPGLSSIRPGRGSRRELTPTQAILVAVAAMLYAQGIRGEALQRVLEEVEQWQTSDQPMYAVTVKLPSNRPLEVTVRLRGLPTLCRAIGLAQSATPSSPTPVPS